MRGELTYTTRKKDDRNICFSLYDLQAVIKAGVGDQTAANKNVINRSIIDQFEEFVQFFAWNQAVWIQ